MNGLVEVKSPRIVQEELELDIVAGLTTNYPELTTTYQIYVLCSISLRITLITSLHSRFIPLIYVTHLSPMPTKQHVS